MVAEGSDGLPGIKRGRRTKWAWPSHGLCTIAAVKSLSAPICCMVARVSLVEDLEYARDTRLPEGPEAPDWGD
jgi:hypothetical protein